MSCKSRYRLERHIQIKSDNQVKLIDPNSISTLQKNVATIGFFDGVHLGHKYLLEQVKTIAHKIQLPSTVITFPVHPRKVLQAEYQPALLCGYDEKIQRLSDVGIDNCISLPFTHELSKLTAREFINQILFDKLHVDTLVIGYDHRFGYDRIDGFEQYVKYANDIGMNVLQAKKLESSLHISSSSIRTALIAGDIQSANNMLGYRYTISGQIVEGFKVGRTIGFPTANIKVWEDFKVIPAFGVYAVYVFIDNFRYKGMLYIGKRPTLHNGDNISLEVNIFDFNQDLYGKTLSLEFVQFVRHDQKFPNLEILIEHITKDKENVIKILKDNHS